MRRHLILALAVLAVGIATVPAVAKGDWTFETTAKFLGFGLEQEPSPSRYNPANILGLNRYETQLHFRPDFTAKNGWIDFQLKPRLTVNRQAIKDGILAGETRTSTSGFLNEGWVRVHFGGELFAGYGRENLQWGPSYLVSPSNPFLTQNGRSVPQVEVPGLEYGRVVWLPGDRLTLSLIANTGEGHLDTFGQFEKTYAAKLDFTGEKKYGGLIVSRREHWSTEVGYFGVLNVSDPWLLYTEGRFAKDDDRSLLLGSSYTLPSSAILAFEYFHDSYGNVPLSENIPGLVAGGGVPTTLKVGKDVVMAQFNTGSRFKHTNLTLRADHILDDGTRFIGQFNHELDDTNELYLTTILNGGAQESVFRHLIDHVVILGTQHSF